MILPPPPPALDDLPAGFRLVAGLGHSEILPCLDVETYSEAGFLWDAVTTKWVKPPGTPPSKKGGLPIVGAANYSLHPTTELLSLAYDLKNGIGRCHWKSGDSLPWALFMHIQDGGLLEAWNAGFEWWIWENVCHRRMGWPRLPAEQMRCAMVKSRGHGWPGKLDDAGPIARIKHLKDADGTRLLDKFSRPRNPTKKDARLRIRPEDDPIDAPKLYAYNITDIVAESEISAKCPDLSPDELEYWQLDQQINRRGVQLDADGVHNCIAVIEQAFAKYNAELSAITGGAVSEASQLPSLKMWCASRGVPIYQLREEDLYDLLARKDLPPDVLRALQIRSLIGSASIKKLYAMRNQMTDAGRLHDLFNHLGARTGRTVGSDVQATNLPRDGIAVYKCDDPLCWRHFGTHRFVCPWCGNVNEPSVKKDKWSFEVFQDAFYVLRTRSLECVEYYFGDAIGLIIGCLRALFIGKTGHNLISSDYSAIEAVVTAALAGEQWRLETFAAGEDIYYASAAKITGKTLEYYKRYIIENGGRHHPDRQPFGKVSELSSCFGGWINAWKQFGADEFFSDDEIKRHILSWRAASPMICELWGGQYRGMPWDDNYHRQYYGLEGCAVQAILNPGQRFTYHANHPLAQPITYLMHESALYCILPSGRSLIYHNARVTMGSAGVHEDALNISFEGWNTNPKMGPYGWITMHTYGGKLTENVVQAVARDIFWYGMLNIARAGYAVVLHNYDEIVAEILKGWGSLEEFERIMSTLPPWAAGWPVKAKGGWIGERYRKD